MTKLDTNKQISLDSLDTGISVIPPQSEGFFKQNCMVCLHKQGHTSGVSLKVNVLGDDNSYSLLWSGEVTERLLKAYGNDHNKATDFGAVAISLLLIRDCTEYNVIEQAYIGSAVDYFLAYKNSDDTLIFNEVVAYLEISGIRSETPDNTIERRIKEKTQRLQRLNLSQKDLPTLISVIEFGLPQARIVQHG